MKYEIPEMIERGGVVINVSSILGTVGTAQTPAYTASKHALVGLTKVAALDYAENNIRVNAVGPGYIETPMLERAGILSDPNTKAKAVGLHPIGRLGTAREVANAIVWLASDEASFITGHTLLIDGGYIAQ
jgi:NAD(P)-dependent dehydrogenase (short-subunit alcohol dehydrogenase family)